MKSQAEFDAFLRDAIAPKLREIEAARRALEARRDAVRVPSAWKIAGAAAGVLAAYAMGEIGPLVALAAAPWAVEVVRRSRIPDTVTPRVRSEVLARVVTFWDESFRYEPARAIAREEFVASGLFAGEAFNAYGGEDHVAGRHGATAFRFSELRVRHVKRRGKRTETHTVFDGLFFVADFNKSFRGRTLVLPDRAERALGSFGRAVQSFANLGSDTELIELECPEFERAFVVRSTDPVEARYLLSPSLMQRIRAFHENTGSRLRIGFAGGRVYVALPLEANLFALPAGRALGLDDVRRWAGELLFATGIVDELDLNTRIWAKAPAA